MVERSLNALFGQEYTRVQIGFWVCCAAIGIGLLITGDSWGIIFAAPGGGPLTIIVLSLLWQRFRSRNHGDKPRLLSALGREDGA